MRRGLGVVLIFMAVLVAGSPAGASGDGPLDHSETQQGAGGELDDDAAHVVVTDGYVGPSTQARPGGGNVVCTWYWPGMFLEPREPVDWEELRNPTGALAEISYVWLIRRCESGPAAGEQIVEVSLPQPEPPDPPETLAIIARGQLPFPLPQVRFAPPLDDPSDFTLVGLPTWIWVDNWQSASRTATAGNVTATVTARPTRLKWDFGPGLADGCPLGNTAYDPTKHLSEQSSDCTILFERPSVREPGGAYTGQVSVVYAVEWTSNIGLSGSLGEVTRTSTVSVRVGEQQVLNR